MKQQTKTGRIPANVGFPGAMKGVTRQLTPKEKQQQKDLRNGKN